MNLIDITKDNWLKVIFLTTNMQDMPTLCEEYVASNALSIVQAKYEKSWITKAIESDGDLMARSFTISKNYIEIAQVKKSYV